MTSVFGEAKWLVPTAYAALAPVDVFHREMEPKTTDLPEALQHRHFLFRGTVALPHAGKVCLRITADDYYKLTANGTFVGQGPAQGYYFHYHWNEYDITPYCRDGVLALEADVYYQGLINRAYNSGDRRMGLVAAVFVDGDYVGGTGEDWLCAADRRYVRSHIIGYDTMFAENRDLSAPAPMFAPAAVKVTDHVFAPTPVTPLSVYKKAPVTVTKIDGGWLYDFGEVLTGGLSLRASGRAGDTVRMLYSEELTDTPERVRYAMRCGCLCDETLTLPDGEVSYTPYEYKGFRYAAVLPAANVTLHEVTATVRHYPFEDDACTLVTDDDALQDVWRICKAAVKYGAQEQYIDCPTREKGQYGGDVLVTAAAQVILTGDTSLYRKAIDDFMQSARLSAGLMAVAPGSLMQEIADYALLFPSLALRYYAMSGDRDFLRENLTVAEGLLAHFAAFARPDGLLEDVTDQWNLVDWPENLRDDYDFPLTRPVAVGSGVHNVLNAFYIGCVDAVERMRTILSIETPRHRDALVAAFNRAFYNAETGLYVDAPTSAHSSLHANVLPLYFGISVDKNEDKIADFLCEKGLCCGVYFAYFLLKALCRVERHADALAFITSTDRHSWMNMVREGATTCFEAWGKEDKWNTSLCHPWACAPISVLAEDILPHMPQVGKICTSYTRIK